jgi:hypothetical protein
MFMAFVVRDERLTALMKEVVRASETPVYFYSTTRCYNADYGCEPVTRGIHCCPKAFWTNCRIL